MAAQVVLPTPAAVRFYDAWAGSAAAAIPAKQQDQFYLANLRQYFDLCDSRGSCEAKRKEVRRGE